VQQDFFQPAKLPMPLCAGIMRQVLGSVAGEERIPVLEDILEIDSTLFNSLQWMLDYDITDVLEGTSETTVEEFGTMRRVDLCPGGAEIDVTEENKADDVQAVVRWHFEGAVRDQLRWLLDGLWEVVPATTLAAFSCNEISLLLNRNAETNVQDLRSGCIRYTGGLSQDSPIVLLFRQVMEESSHKSGQKYCDFVRGHRRGVTKCHWMDLHL
jgi:hypothetical protein